MSESLTVEGIIAGSVRPNSRLAKSHKMSAKCRCGKDREDLDHVFDECEDHRDIRAKYQQRIDKEVERDAETRQELKDLLSNPVFRTCGIAPESPELLQSAVGR